MQSLEFKGIYIYMKEKKKTMQFIIPSQLAIFFWETFSLPFDKGMDFLVAPFQKRLFLKKKMAKVKQSWANSMLLTTSHNIDGRKLTQLYTRNFPKKGIVCDTHTH